VVEEILDMGTERQQLLNDTIDILYLRQENHVINFDSLGGNTQSIRTDAYRYHAISSSYPG
jgi:hypothetical protein